MPVNATAETFLPTRELAPRLERRRVAVPVFMALSADDPVIDVAVSCSYVEQRFSHPGSRLVVFRRNPSEGTDPGDARISYCNRTPMMRFSDNSTPFAGTGCDSVECRRFHSRRFRLRALHRPGKPAALRPPSHYRCPA